MMLWCSLTLPPEEAVLLVVHVHRPSLPAGHTLLKPEQLGEHRLHGAPAGQRRAVASVRRDPRVLIHHITSRHIMRQVAGSEAAATAAAGLDGA